MRQNVLRRFRRRPHSEEILLENENSGLWVQLKLENDENLKNILKSVDKKEFSFESIIKFKINYKKNFLLTISCFRYLFKNQKSVKNKSHSREIHV